jgi:hypothetical protein
MAAWQTITTWRPLTSLWEHRDTVFKNRKADQPNISQQAGCNIHELDKWAKTHCDSDHYLIEKN